MISWTNARVDDVADVFSDDPSIAANHLHATSTASATGRPRPTRLCSCPPCDVRPFFSALFFEVKK
jgi:hypothetical protein